jgi:hypothetical protein
VDARGDAKLRQFRIERKERKEKRAEGKSASIAGARPMPPIRGRSGRPLRRWQMKAILG